MNTGLPESPKRILVAQTTFLGDLVLSTPLLQRLRDAFPHAMVTALVNSGLEPVLANNPAVDDVIGFEKQGAHSGLYGLLVMAKVLRSREFDTALILPGSVRTAMAVRFAGIPRRIGTSLSSGMALFGRDVRFPRESLKSMQGRVTGWLDGFWRGTGNDQSIVSELYTDVVRPDPSRTAVHRHLQLLEPLGIEAREASPRPLLFPGDKERKTITSLLAPLQGRTCVALAPGSRWPTKRWSQDHFAELGKVLVREGIALVVIGGPGDRESCEFIEAALDHTGSLNVCGLLSVLESCELLRRCGALISNDSAPIHLAAAMDTPAIAVLGPTVSRFGYIVPSSRLVVVENDGLWCRPCTPHGGERCPIGTHECMTSIASQHVLSVVHDLLKNP